LSTLAPAYRPRRPTETVLYGIVRGNLETFLAHARDSYLSPLPRYVEDELRSYLKCGVLAHGFIRAHCNACGHDLLVAFACKGRSVCPSCAGRRMANTAAHLVDRVLPAVPVRQWVLSLPWELRALAAFEADVLSALVRIFIEALFTRYQKCASDHGLGEVACGAITHVQRFGSSLDLNVHFHVIVADGVFVRDVASNPTFHAAPPPTREELSGIVRRVRRRAIAWLARKGHLKGSSDPDVQDSPAQTSLDACAAIAMRRGVIQSLRDDVDAEKDLVAAADTPPANGNAVECDGFNLHASVVVSADDDLGRERLMRYGARPPLALDRIRRLPGGRIAYRIKNLRDGRAKNRGMTSLEFMARLAALVPPPRLPLLRYHGVFAPRSRWRREVVPRPRDSRRGPCVPSPMPCAGVSTTRLRRALAPRSSYRRAERARVPRDQHTGARLSGPLSSPTRPEVATMLPAVVPPALTPQVEPMRKPDVELLVPNVLSVKHWNRLHGGLLYASPRIDWARLLSRSFDVDVLVCPKCHGRLRVLDEVTDLAMVSLVLESLGLPAEAPRPARARDPTTLFADVDEN
jgi:hypothetical protein